MSELFLSSSGKTNMFVLKQRKHTAGNFLTLFSLFGSGERVDTTRAVVKLFSDRQLLHTTELSLCFCLLPQTDIKLAIDACKLGAGNVCKENESNSIWPMYAFLETQS